jgi:dihydropteroate synthase
MTRDRIGKIIEAMIDHIAENAGANLFGVIEPHQTRDQQISEFYARIDEFEAAALRQADARYGKGN